LEKSGAQIVVVDELKQMEKVREIKKRMPHLKCVIQTQTRESFGQYTESDGFYTWDELLNINTDDVEEEYRNRLANIAANECCS
jgi:long-chain-fatty-acid--CoA ligase ACSBG